MGVISDEALFSNYLQSLHVPILNSWNVWLLWNQMS